jgi:hypothetical protein
MFCSVTFICTEPDNPPPPELSFQTLRGGVRGRIIVLLFSLWGYWHCGHSWPTVPASGDNEDDCGEADGM